MKIIMAIFSLVIMMGFVNASQARVEVDQSKYTCKELTELLYKYESIWVQNKLFPFIKQNIALRDPVCNGDRSSRDRVCRYYTGYATAKDGGCNLGIECSCERRERRGGRDD